MARWRGLLAGLDGQNRAFARALDALARWPHGRNHERSPRHLWQLPRDYELAIRWLRPSFLNRDHWTPGRKGRDIHGTSPVRYVDPGEADLRAARSEKRAHVCLRTDGLRFCAHRQCTPGDRVRRAVPAAAAHLRREAR